MRLEFAPTLPEPYDQRVCWAKCDMIYQVSFERLSLPFYGKLSDGSRLYYQIPLAMEKMKEIQQSVAFSVGLSD